ncbi:helix-turn-helix domain-containing protein [Streptomyces sp. M19]
MREPGWTAARGRRRLIAGARAMGGRRPVVASAERPRTMRADAKRNRDKLLSAATGAFRDFGADASLEGIAREAGVGIGTLYRHFPTRRDLVLAAYCHEVEGLCATASDLLAAMPPDRALREWLDRLTRYTVTKHALAEALSTSAGACPDGAEAANRAGLPAVYGQIVAALTTLLDAGARTGTLRRDAEPDTVILAMSALWHLTASDHWQDRARRYLDLLMDGLRAGAPNATPA